MRAIILEQAGSSENLKIKEVTKPTIRENEVLVAVKAMLKSFILCSIKLKVSRKRPSSSARAI